MWCIDSDHVNVKIIDLNTLAEPKTDIASEIQVKSEIFIILILELV